MPERLSCDLARLTASNPKDLRLNGKVTTCSIAAAFYQGLIDCESPTRTAPLAVYLQAEGPKRVPAFVYERLFINRMRTNHEVSENWYVCGARDTSAPSIWFRLMSTERDWGALDAKFAGLLMHQGIPVWTARFEGRGLWLSEAGGHHRILSARQFLDQNPCSMPTERGRVRSMLSDGEVAPNALRMLHGAGVAAGDELLRSRIFINCFLELTGGRPFDVDAICSADGRIFVAEFKRKYPSEGNYFGVDTHLVKLPHQLRGVCPLYHFVLHDLRGWGSKGTDPTSALVSAYDEGNNFEWHAIKLSPDFENTFTHRLQTRGKDSGQNGGKRLQVGIPIRAFTHISGNPFINFICS